MMSLSNKNFGPYFARICPYFAHILPIFGAFFGGFHCVKYGVRVALDPGEYAEIALATAISMGGLVSRPNFRPAVPYASMLIMMDSFHLVMRQFRND